MKRLIIIGLLASAAWAADFSQKSTEEMGQRGMNNKPTFAEYDLNNDGRITPKELEEGRAKRINKHTKEGKMLKNVGKAPAFTDIDTNKDGIIIPEEFLMYQGEHMQNCLTFG